MRCAVLPSVQSGLPTVPGRRSPLCEVSDCVQRFVPSCSAALAHPEVTNPTVVSEQGYVDDGAHSEGFAEGMGYAAAVGFTRSKVLAGAHQSRASAGWRP